MRSMFGHELEVNRKVREKETTHGDRDQPVGRRERQACLTTEFLLLFGSPGFLIATKRVFDEINEIFD